MIIGNVKFVSGKAGASSGGILDVTVHGGVKEDDTTRSKFMQHAHLKLFNILVSSLRSVVHTVQCNIPVYTLARSQF